MKIGIQDAVNFYKMNIDKYWNNENYKWIAVKTFQDNWNIEADDFAAMLVNSLSRAYNLLGGPMYYPKQMICEFANVKPEEVRGLFKLLFDENTQLAERIKAFQSGFDKLLKYYRENLPGHEKTNSHYQDLRAICVYLSFRYPEKYFLYKAQMYSNFQKLVSYTGSSKNADPTVRKYDNFSNLCQEVINEVKKDNELLEMQQERVQENEKYYDDSELHVLAQTIIYVFPDINDASTYWPSTKEYDPGITTEKWKSILTNPSITTENNLQMFALMLDYGKPATCIQLAEQYKKSPNYFNSGSSSYAERVAKATGCPVPSEDINDNAKWWPILYVGRVATKDEKGGYVWKFRDELKSALEQIDLPEISEGTEVEVTNSLQLDHNLILYGPPGTGKTYYTAIYAVAICDNHSFEEVHSWEYSDIMKRFNELKSERRVEFTTFHQSYGYEEFIEGIKPVISSGATEETKKDVQYDYVDGVFKAFCKRASEIKQIQVGGVSFEKPNPRVWCLMLDRTGQSKLKKYCFENNEIRIGWPELPERITSETEVSTEFSRSMLTYFQDDMEIGDIVVIQKKFDRIDAVGIVAGDYEFDKGPFEGEWPRKRKVTWLATGIDVDLLELNGGKHLGRPSIYPLDRVKAKDIIQLSNSETGNKTISEEESRPYVFIIDEINRGNISKIFGELITLIEDTKRSGQKEAVSVKLPYSGEEFSVPDNVYIIGTMNTADRSIALMDTALRRRFRFEEMMPKADILRKEHADIVEGIDVAVILEKINERITFLYDREHTIGHSFFLPLKDDATITKLGDIFAKSVIPLLQEYFYEDYRKIQLVLGDNAKSKDEYKFILEEPAVASDIFKGDVIELENEPNKKYKINEEAFLNPESYKEII